MALYLRCLRFLGAIFVFISWCHKAGFKYFGIIPCVLSVIASTFWAKVVGLSLVVSGKRGVLAWYSRTYMMLGVGLNNSIFTTQTWERRGKNPTAHPLTLSGKLFKVVYLLRRLVPYQCASIYFGLLRSGWEIRCGLYWWIIEIEESVGSLQIEGLCLSVRKM